MKNRIVMSDLSLSSVAKKVNSDFAGCTGQEVVGSLAVSKRFEEQCDKLYRKTKTHIESKMLPIDVESIFGIDAMGVANSAEIVAVNTLFGAEYLLGETRWQLRGVTKTSAKNSLINAANSNKDVFDALVKHGILVTTLTIDYSRIHSILAPLKSKSAIPDELAVLREVVEIVETGRTVRVSTIKENFVEEK